MPKNGVPQSRQRRETAAAEREAKAPLTERRKSSPLAKMLRNPTRASIDELMDAATNGELTPVDIQAGIAAQLVSARQLLPKAGRPPNDKLAAQRNAERESARAVMVLLKQLIESLKDTVIESGGGGPLLVIELLWPSQFAHTDIGEQVRLKAGDAAPPSGYIDDDGADDDDDDQEAPDEASPLDEDDPSAAFLRGFK